MSCPYCTCCVLELESSKDVSLYLHTDLLSNNAMERFHWICNLLMYMCYALFFFFFLSGDVHN